MTWWPRFADPLKARMPVNTGCLSRWCQALSDLMFLHSFRFILQLCLPVLHFTSRGLWVAPFTWLWSGRLFVLPRLAFTYCFDFSKRVNIMSFLYIYLAPSLLQMLPLLLYSQMLPKVIPAAYSSMALEVFSLRIPSFSSEKHWNLELWYSHTHSVFIWPAVCLFWQTGLRLGLVLTLARPLDCGGYLPGLQQQWSFYCPRLWGHIRQECCLKAAASWSSLHTFVWTTKCKEYSFCQTGLKLHCCLLHAVYVANCVSCNAPIFFFCLFLCLCLKFWIFAFSAWVWLFWVWPWFYIQ